VPNLTSNAILDVVIGLAFFYFLLSIVCSAINEGIATTFKLRARDLEKGIRNLLGSEGAAKFYNHWRVGALHEQRKRKGGRPPSYIPSRVFALTVLDTVAPPTDSADSHDLIARARAAVGKDEHSETVKGLLQDALDEAGEKRDAVRAALERSYDETMERVSGWYKRRVQLILFVVAIVVVAGINADSFTIGQQLWKNDALRSAVVAQANETVAQSQAECAKNDAETDAQKAARCLDEVKELGIPVGWTTDTSPHNWKDVLGKVFGLLLTVFAVQLGAPFWFDLLGKVSRLRGSGQKPSNGK